MYSRQMSPFKSVLRKMLTAHWPNYLAQQENKNTWVSAAAMLLPPRRKNPNLSRLQIRHHPRRRPCSLGNGVRSGHFRPPRGLPRENKHTAVNIPSATRPPALSHSQLCRRHWNVVDTQRSQY